MREPFRPETHYPLLRSLDLVIDSRQVQMPTRSVFFAFRGKHYDGHGFVAGLYAQGVRHFVVDQSAALPEQAMPGALVLEAESVVAALQELVAYHRQQFSLPVVGITGSNAKTIVKEWLGRLLAPGQQVIKSPKSYNSQVGVPLSVWPLGPAHTVGVFEAGVSRLGEMAKLAAIIRPTIGIFTNIGTAHDEGFASRHEKIQEKLHLFANCRTLVYCQQHAQLKAEIEAWATGRAVELFGWGTAPGAALRLMSEVRTSDHTQLACWLGGEEATLRLPFTDTPSLENCLHCVATLVCLGYRLGQVQQLVDQVFGTARNRVVPMRLELKRGQNGNWLIDDTYNNDLAGLAVALDFLAQHDQARPGQGPNRTVILSDMPETGLPSHLLYPQIAQVLASHRVGKLIAIGEQLARHQADFHGRESYFFANVDAFLAAHQRGEVPLRHEMVLVKGARAFGFERIAAQLQEKIHGTVLEINLDALAWNLGYYRSLLLPGVKVMVMVKALAYGSGSSEVANLLQRKGADYLAVAYADEGVRLRQAGVSLPIMVMNPASETFATLLAYRLEPELYSFRLLDQWLGFLAKQPVAGPYPVHLKIDTGMHRLGFLPTEVPELLAKLADHQSAVRVVAQFTHLAGADEARLADFSRQQLDTFRTVAAQVEAGLGYPTLKHALNSAGIVRFPDDQLDMVRLGIGLYGIEPAGLAQAELQVVGTLKTTISQIKSLPAGQTVGYGRHGLLQHDSRIGTIAIGYADGYDRRLGQGRGRVWVNGHLAPVMGNVCMDMTMIDLTGIAAEEGDEVIVFGASPTLNELAQQLGTIPYEIMTSIGDRVKRVFYSG
jgi:Alr-MurF fusion protein